jgi:anti-sigma B factor antagonist
VEAGKRDAGDVTIIDLVGNIRTNDDYALFKQSIDDALARGKSKLILNFGGVNFINSSGLGRLVLAAKRAKESGGAIKIVNLSDDLRELFTFTRLDAKIPVCATEEEAIKAFS